MRKSVAAILAGGATLAVAAMTPALAGDGPVHVLTIGLPDGAVEQIHYTGNNPPRVGLVPEPLPTALPVVSMPVMSMPAMQLDPFATLERISALMDQQAAAMLQQAAMLPGLVTSGLPAGTSGYSFIATTSGNGMCTQSVRITYAGGGAKPQMVSSASGDCGSAHGTQTPLDVHTQAPSFQHPTTPGVIEARWSAMPTSATPKPATHGNIPVQEVAWNQ